MRAELEGIILDGTDATASPYTITSIDGWDDGVDTRRESIDRPGGHGQFHTPGYLSGRLITIAGEIYTDSDAAQDHAILRLTGALADGSTGKLTVTTSQTAWAMVQRNGPPDIVRDRWGLLATYQLQLWAVDPRKYGEAHDYPAGVPAVQYGNFPARPQLVVSGSSSGGYTVTGPDGRRVVVTKAITSGAPHTIDFAQGGLYVDGVRQLRAISIYEPWTVGPGLPSVTAGVSGGLDLVQRVTDTYI